MNVQRILELIDVVAAADLAQLTVTDGGVEIQLVRNAAFLDAGFRPEAEKLPGSSAGAHAASSPEDQGLPAGRANDAPQARHQVLAPMVGTFRRSAKADGEALIQLGARVEKGAPLCVIEAMKMMNEIEADRAGTVTQVHCEDGQAVEIDQPLFSID
ncbi:MAG: acetyl-CoA carboxylase, biotin carboxyl carrier protein [Burkholderiales bacterium GWA2_64_37]|nr:MAG: acetyl-CoA carboxylase, biotin carboxyl carrier protein [Burkholderiales bacterium GWA2_64_37]